MDLKANLIKSSEKEGEKQIQDLGKKIQSTINCSNYNQRSSPIGSSNKSFLKEITDKIKGKKSIFLDLIRFEFSY